MMRTSFSQGVVTMQIHWLWLAAGFLPYSIKRQFTKNEQTLTVKALFWQLMIRWKEGQYVWDLYVPFIDHLRQ